MLPRSPRVLIIPFVVAYTALDSILGIAWGIAVETANDLPAEDQSGAGRLIDELISGDPDPRGLLLYWGAGLLWLAVALAAVAALRQIAPFLIGIAWTEFRPRLTETWSKAGA